MHHEEELPVRNRADVGAPDRQDGSRPRPKPSVAHYAVVALSVAAAASGGIAFLAHEQGTSIPSLIDRLSRVFAVVNFNNGLFVELGDVELSFFLAGVLVFAIVIQLVVAAAVRLASRTTERSDRFVGARDAAVGVVLLVAAVQAIGTAGIFLEERDPLAHPQSLDYYRLNRRISGEVDRLQELIPPGSTVRFVTDMPYKRRDPGMYSHRALKYFLYPSALDDSGAGGEADYILYYRKRRIAASLPPGYRIIGKLNAETAVAARSARGRGDAGR